LNVEYFIAKRLIAGKEHKFSISAPIIKIAIAAIALGLVMMLIAVATGVGLKLKIREKVTAFNGHVQIYNYDNNQSEVSVVPISNQQDFYPKFTSVAGIDHIQAVATKAGIIRTAETFEGIISKGVGGDYNWKALENYLVAGALPDYANSLNNDVLMSQLMANRLQLKVGDSFFAFFLRNDDVNKIPNQRKFKVQGLYDSGFEEIDGLYLFVDIRHVQRINKWKEDEIGNFEIFLNDFDTIDAKSAEIYDSIGSSLDTRTLKDKYANIFDWIGLFDFNIALIIGILIIVCGFNMITALLVLILERTPMIGILKALGATNWSIRKVFLYNATYLIGVGLFWGNLIGVGFIFLQNKFRFLKFPNPEEYYIAYIPVHLDAVTVLVLNAGIMLLCLIMLLVPSYIITKITPVKAIRFE